jgi:hypothetical protein
METLSRELWRHLRSLLRYPGFTIIVILTLALGIGVNTAIFSVVPAILLNPLPFHESNRIVTLTVGSNLWVVSGIWSGFFIVSCPGASAQPSQK